MAEQIDFEKSLAELTDIIEQMESGSLSLEQSLQKFEQGVKLTRDCQKALKAAEQRVKILIEANSDAALADFDAEQDAD